MNKEKKWVAFAHRSRNEDSAGRYDESENGPYALDGICKYMLCKAYGITEDEKLKKIPRASSRVSPSELERIARKAKS